ncbi:MAG: DMT family transporter, partial [Magnetovibrio sp.]|nr:DMT family transporter [Magnetovibrio sp.]
PLKGIFWMLVYGLFISGMHVSIRYVSTTGIHPFEIAFFRNLFGLIAVVPWFIKLGWAPLRTNRMGMLVARGTVNTFCMLGFFMAVSLTPLAEVTALGFTAPIFATLLAIFVFRERVGLRRWSAIAVGFFGVMVVLRPGFHEIGLGQILVLSSALGWGICMLMIKDLGRTESSVTTTTYMSLVMAPLSLVPALFYWTWPSWEQLAWLAFLGTLGGIGQMAVAESLRWAPTHVVAPIDFTRLLIVAGLAYLFFAEVPDSFTWLGGTMIFAATAFIAYREHKVREARRKSA